MRKGGKEVIEKTRKRADDQSLIVTFLLQLREKRKTRWRREKHDDDVMVEVSS